MNLIGNLFFAVRIRPDFEQLSDINQVINTYFLESGHGNHNLRWVFNHCRTGELQNPVNNNESRIYAHNIVPDFVFFSMFKIQVYI